MVCVGGLNGYCALVKIPDELQNLLGIHIKRKLAGSVHDALLAAQASSLSLQEAWELSISPRNCSRSAQKWLYSHFMLMVDVRAEEIPDVPSFNGMESFWWEKLYFRASSFVLGKLDWDIMKELVKEAEGI